MKLKHRFPVKPLSANKMWGAKGKRVFKSKEYLDYQNEIRAMLIGDSATWPFGQEPVAFIIEAGLSSKLADLDNILKPLFDTYQNMYEEFNDKTVYKIDAIKTLTSRGDEFLDVEVRYYQQELQSESSEEEGGEESKPQS